jgi:tetratricopeptide (TPR) repeat protein
MKSTMTAIALALAFNAAPAIAQAPAPAQTSAVNPDLKQPSKGALKAIQELKAAVTAKDAANIPAKVAAARAVASTADDRYWVGALQYVAAKDAKDEASRAIAIEEILTSGKSPQSDVPLLTLELADAYVATKQLDKAASVVERAIAVQPGNVDAVLTLAEIRKDQGRPADAVAALQKAIADAPGKADERLYQHAVQFAYDSKLPATKDIARQWLEAYPSPKSWRNSLLIYRQTALDKSAELDFYRLARAAGTLEGNDAYGYAAKALVKGYPGEAKAVLDEAIAAKTLDASKPEVSELRVAVNAKAQAYRPSLATLAKEAAAAPSAKHALVIGDAYYGYGDYAKAAELYRLALTKSGADPSVINLHLGMALARSGDKAGARGALNAVNGELAELAKYWLAYLSTRS